MGEHSQAGGPLPKQLPKHSFRKSKWTPPIHKLIVGPATRKMCRGFLFCKFWRILPGTFPGGLFWALLPTKKEEKNPATKSAKNPAAQNKNP